ncbi:hypothetical protein DFH08DRAFT_939881 [Mycena albidolilacea]|uniref:Uncharacterized protein n=1 Tax=Mycena albidolilacea TaxID=1033008 RepID=A0AAD7EJS5_9AGAR|nr:hypothetical protein DFH08DRAFT_939881 [Mycena albidolilacea]
MVESDFSTRVSMVYYQDRTEDEGAEERYFLQLLENSKAIIRASKFRREFPSREASYLGAGVASKSAWLDHNKPTYSIHDIRMGLARGQVGDEWSHFTKLSRSAAHRVLVDNKNTLRWRKPTLGSPANPTGLRVYTKTTFPELSSKHLLRALGWPQYPNGAANGLGAKATRAPNRSTVRVQVQEHYNFQVASFRQRKVVLRFRQSRGYSRIQIPPGGCIRRRGLGLGIPNKPCNFKQGTASSRLICRVFLLPRNLIRQRQTSLEDLVPRRQRVGKRGFGGGKRSDSTKRSSTSC